MKQKPVDGYRPNYPKKLIKGAALTVVTFLIYKPLSPVLHGKIK